MRASLFPLFSRGYRLTTDGFTFSNVFSNKWKEIKAEFSLHLVALLEEIEHE